MYSSAGYQTCAGYPAIFEYEWTDAASFAEWGVDYLKYDYCYYPTNVSVRHYGVSEWRLRLRIPTRYRVLRLLMGESIIPVSG